jgi:signal transduction histidine kinase
LERKPSAKEKEMLLNMTYLASVAIEKHQNITALKESKKELVDYAQKLEEKVEARTKEVMETVQKLVETNLNLEDQIMITKQAESDAIASKSIASEIAKNFPNGFIAVIDKDFKVAFAEGEALAQLGLKEFSKEGILVDDVTVFSEERKTKIKEYTTKTLTGQHLAFEISYKNRYFVVNTAPLYDEHNKISYALHVYNDISEQKAFEFKIQNAFKKEKELSELKSRFVSMASHEFRTPLSAILTSAVLIGKQNEPGKELKREKYVEQIERNVKNMVVILNDFLSLSKLEEGKVLPLLERFDLISFSKLLIKEINPILKKGQTINFGKANNELLVHLDAKLLRHILSNLLANASKYAFQETVIDFIISQNQEKLLIQITDHGMGIPKEEQHYLFDRFFRAKNAANFEGTGLGLNIVKSYTELMGGSIGFESQLNIGTTFWIAFPLNNRE